MSGLGRVSSVLTKMKGVEDEGGRMKGGRWDGSSCQGRSRPGDLARLRLASELLPGAGGNCTVL